MRYQLYKHDPKPNTELKDQMVLVSQYDTDDNAPPQVLLTGNATGEDPKAYIRELSRVVLDPETMQQYVVQNYVEGTVKDFTDTPVRSASGIAEKPKAS